MDTALPRKFPFILDRNLAKAMEVELLWRRPNALSVALRGACVSYVWQEFVRCNRAAIGGPSKRQPMKSLQKLSHKPPRSSIR